MRAGLRSYARRDYDINQRVTLRNGFVGQLSVIRAIGSNLSKFLFDLIEQWPYLGRVIDVLLCQYGSNDLPSVGVQRQVQRSPAATRLLAMLFKQPFAFIWIDWVTESSRSDAISHHLAAQTGPSP